MATGPEHYRAAERLLALAQNPEALVKEADGITYRVSTERRAEARFDALVNAVLALAAATAITYGGGYIADSKAWDAVASETRTKPPSDSI